MTDKHEITRWWDWPSAVFLILAFYCSTSRLQTTNWTEYLGRIQILMLLAAGLGLALGYTRFKAWISFLIATLYTILIPGWSLVALIQADTWWERTASLLGRLVTTGRQLIANQPVRDPILFLTTMVLLYWIACLSSSYRLVRLGRPWGGLAVAGLVVLVVEYSFEMYAAPDSGAFFSSFFVLFCVLLMARLYFLRSSKEWQKRGHIMENEVGFDLGRGAAVAAVVLVFFAWMTPRVVRTLTPGSQDNISVSQEIQRFRERFEKAVNSLRSPAPVTVTAMGATLGLGQGTNLSNEIVFTVSPQGGQLTTARYYWLGRVYDGYRNNQWEALDEPLVKMGPPTGPQQYQWSDRLKVTLDINSRVTYLRTLYFAGALEDISRSVSVVSLPATSGEADVTTVYMDPPLRAGETYRVIAEISTPTILALQKAGELPYPEYIQTRYLDLPSDFSPRIRDLAQQITQGQETPYDKVVAVTDYLRNNITYEASLPQMPVTADPLEWFLFVHKAGFCNYYASSEVLMLRSIGIPARLAVGYAAGEWNSAQKRYDVRAKDYHAWPEVYFPGIGWVPFEPTSAQPVLDYPQGSVADNSSASIVPQGTQGPPPEAIAREPEDVDTAARSQEFLRQRLIRRVVVGSGSAVAVAGLCFGLFKLFEVPIRMKIPVIVYTEGVFQKRGWRIPRWMTRWARLARRTPMEKLFANVSEQLQVWGKPATPNLTPSEQVGLLANLVPEVAGEAATLLEEYQREIYGRGPANYRRAREAAEDLRATGYRAWMNRKKSRGS